MLERVVTEAFQALEAAPAAERRTPWHRSVGTITQVGDGIARIAGLPGAKVGEILLLEGGWRALVYDLDPDSVGAILLDHAPTLQAGARVEPTGTVALTPVGVRLAGRVMDPLGRPLDGGGPVHAEAWYPVEREAVPIMARSPVTVPLATGVKVVDALVPIGRGQRELILGDRKTGKTTLAVDTIINQRGAGVTCIYVSIGQRQSQTEHVIDLLRRHGAMEYTHVVAAAGDDTPGLRYMAPYAATSQGEYLMEQGHDVLIVYDDLTKHAQAYREISLLLRRPPGREAFPGDIFYAHSRLLERSGRLRPERGGGSLTALPIAETEAEDISGYIPTNLISITDGQVYLSSRQFQKGIRPAVHIGQSVSRVGGKTQLAAYRRVASRLKLEYSQFEELEFFSRLGTRLDEVSEQIIERGRRIREMLKQPPVSPIPLAEQIGLLLALTEGVFDGVAPEDIAACEDKVRTALQRDAADILDSVTAGHPLDDEQKERLLALARQAVAGEPPAADDGMRPEVGKERERRRVGAAANP